MQSEKVFIYDIEDGNVNILGAEQGTVKLTKTGMFLCKEGEIDLTIDGEAYHLSRNSLIVYFSYSNLHIVAHSKDLRGILIGVDLETIQPMLYQVSNFNALFVIKQRPCQQITEEQAATLTRHVMLFSEVALRAEAERTRRTGRPSRPVAELSAKQTELLSHSLILEVLQCYANVGVDSEPISRKDEVLQKFVVMLYRTYRKEHEVAYYANQQFLTSRYFSTIVRERSGKSPSQWIATALLVDAQNLLANTSMTVKEISDVLGFPNQSYFGKWFKNLMTIGPLEFRKGKTAIPQEDTDFADVVRRGVNHVRDTQGGPK